MNEDQRQRCEAAGMDANTIERVDQAVSKFNAALVRDRVVNTLIEAWKSDQD